MAKKRRKLTRGERIGFEVLESIRQMKRGEVVPALSTHARKKPNRRSANPPAAG